jgi:hypothetical protein
VLRATETAALGAGWRTEQHETTRQVERIQSEATNIDAVPFANQEDPLRRMPGLKRLLVDRGAQLRNGGCEAAPAGSLLTPTDGSNDTHTAIGSIDAYLHRCTKELVVETLLGREKLKGEGAPDRFGEER